MNKSERLKALLERGYFPEELPPPFNTKDVAIYRKAILDYWGTLGEYPKTIWENYSYPRIKNSRRNLAIVNPIAQLHLAKIIADNWIAIKRHISTKSYSVECPDINPNTVRAVPPPNFELVSLKHDELAASYDYALVSDISRFYGTLYTHAIPWALHGKSWSKANLNLPAYGNSLGARLDKAVRKGQDNQTIGIPIGPDTSRIVSEIVAVSIDNIIIDKLNLPTMRAYRHVDDWFIGFDNVGGADDAVSVISGACRNFELELNTDKTKTIHAARDTGTLWPSDLKRYKYTKTSQNLGSLDYYFSKVFEYSKLYPSQNVLDFGVKRSRSFDISKVEWHHYETFLLKSVRINITCLPAVCQILTSYKNLNYSVGLTRIGKLIEDLILKNAPCGQYAEVSWALFLAKALRIKISQKSAAVVSSLESSVCALLALDLESRNLVDGGLDKTLWNQSMNASGLKSSMWLLAYEADLKGWLSGPIPNYVENDPYFSKLKSLKISFYDENKNVSHIRRLKPLQRSMSLTRLLAQVRAAAVSGATYY